MEVRHKVAMVKSGGEEHWKTRQKVMRSRRVGWGKGVWKKAERNLRRRGISWKRHFKIFSAFNDDEKGYTDCRYVR